MKTLKEKMTCLDTVIWNCYCSPSLFWENVDGYGDKSRVMKALAKAETEKDIHEIVEQYI